MAFWGEYVSVAQRQAKARQLQATLRKKGHKVDPVAIEGRTIVRSFWGKRWCQHLESFSDYSNRLSRGRSYVRHGAVCHLAIESGTIFAQVSGSSLYQVKIGVTALQSKIWDAVKTRCAGQIASMLELLEGKLSKHVMGIVCDRDHGLFPSPREITLSCSCPDGARMCKHVAATLYGVGHRLDREPDLLFRLRGVDPVELLTSPVATPIGSEDEESLNSDDLASLFGIDMDAVPAAKVAPRVKSAGKPRRKLLSSPPTGREVARLRSQLKMTVAEFSRAVGVTPASIYRWEQTSGKLVLKAASEASLRQLAEHRA